MKLTNKAGRQIGIPGNPALILDKDQTVSITLSQLNNILSHQMVKGWFHDGELVVTKKGKVKQVVDPDEYIDRYRPIKPKPKRKRKPRIKMRTEPKFVSVGPSPNHLGTNIPLNELQKITPESPPPIPEDHDDESGFWPDWWDDFDKAVPPIPVAHDSFEDYVEPNYVNMIDVHPHMDYRNQSVVTRDKRRLRRYRAGAFTAPKIIKKGYTKKAIAPVKPKPKYRFMDYVGLVDALGCTPPESQGHQFVPPDILTKAIINNRRVGIDLLALGKPIGDIFNPGHWMYEDIRDNYTSILEYHPESVRA